MIASELLEAAADILNLCSARGLKLATAESCTGGLISAALTDIAGASNVFDRGYITYSNAAKITELHVSAEIIRDKGAVSAEVALAMATGAVKASKVDIALGVTGIAGPDGGTPEKPVGLVHIAAAHRSGKTFHHEYRFGDLGRSEIRRRSAIAALKLTKELIAQL